MTDCKFKNWLFPDHDDKGEEGYRVSCVVEQYRVKKRGREGLRFHFWHCHASEETGDKEASFTGKLILLCLTLNVKIKITSPALKINKLHSYYTKVELLFGDSRSLICKE